MIGETCPRCYGWVWHRTEPCNCKKNKATFTGTKKEFVVALGERLRAIRQAKRLSMDELATMAGMSKTGLWQIERGRSEPMASTIVALSFALNVSTEMILLKDVTA